MNSSTQQFSAPYIIDKNCLNSPLSKQIESYPQGIVIILDKPYGWTSADAVRKIKFSLQRWFGEKNIKVGHAGTLDPLATGVLIICAGKATRLAEHYQSQIKGYIAGITFGATTPSFDLEREIDATYPCKHITLESINSILPQFTGEQDQIPPLFSAKLIDGNRAYDIARAGSEAIMKPSRITIYSIKALSYTEPLLSVEIVCSKGTYVRSIARDLGFALESGGHLTDLVRSSSGEFKVENAISMDNLKLFLQ
ncbi:MAG: tRNA pseudouridine(55) synthase TruB [Bacteroidales bacterium]